MSPTEHEGQIAFEAWLAPEDWAYPERCDWSRAPQQSWNRAANAVAAHIRATDPRITELERALEIIRTQERWGEAIVGEALRDARNEAAALRAVEAEGK